MSVKVDHQFCIGRSASIKHTDEALPALKECWRQLVEAFNNAGRVPAHIEVRVWPTKT